jgi:hypothetical protein
VPSLLLFYDGYRRPTELTGHISPLLRDLCIRMTGRYPMHR